MAELLLAPTVNTHRVDEVTKPKDNDAHGTPFSWGACEKHPGLNLEFYCHEDNSILCSKCYYIDHNNHKASPLEQAVLQMLEQRLERLRVGENYLQQHLRYQRAKSEFFQSTVQDLKKAIKTRAHAPSTGAEEAREEMIQKLDRIYELRMSEEAEYTKYVNEKVDSLRYLLERLSNDPESSLDVQVDERYSDHRLKQWLKEQQSSAFQHHKDLLLFLEDSPTDAPLTGPPGTVSQMTGKITKIFSCGENPETSVHSICVCSNGFIDVAYSTPPGPEPDALHDAWVAQFSPKGKLHGKEPQAIKGKVCLSALEGGVMRVEGQQFPAMNFQSKLFDAGDATDSSDSKLYDIYTKLSARFLLRACRSSRGLCQIRKVTVTGHDTTDELVCHIAAVDPVAVDASRDGRVFAVVEKGGRDVKLYRHDGTQSPTHDEEEAKVEPYAVYAGNGQPFDPRDVCFFTIGGKETLLVADGQNDVLHVLDVGLGGGEGTTTTIYAADWLRGLRPFLGVDPGVSCCKLMGQVGADCMELDKPTALCPDTQPGRLWIGCLGGHVLTLSYV